MRRWRPLDDVANELTSRDDVPEMADTTAETAHGATAERAESAQCNHSEAVGCGRFGAVNVPLVDALDAPNRATA